MATILIIPSCLVLKFKNQKNVLPLNEARRANLNANTRILQLKPFGQKFYTVTIAHKGGRKKKEKNIHRFMSFVFSKYCKYY